MSTNFIVRFVYCGYCSTPWC